MASSGDNGLTSGSTGLQSTELQPEQEKEPERSAPLTITPLGNSYYGSQTSLNEDQKIPGTPDTPIGEWLSVLYIYCGCQVTIFLKLALIEQLKVTL